MRKSGNRFPQHPTLIFRIDRVHDLIAKWESRLLRQRSFDHAQKLINRRIRIDRWQARFGAGACACGGKDRALAAQGLTPGLAVVLVGEDPASQVYVKSRQGAHAAGFTQFNTTFQRRERSGSACPDQHLNADSDIHGILLQLPLPNRFDPSRVIEAISPARMSMACIRSMPGCSRAVI